MCMLFPPRGAEHLSEMKYLPQGDCIWLSLKMQVDFQSTSCHFSLNFATHAQ